MWFSMLLALVPTVGADVFSLEMSFGEHGALHQPCNTSVTAVNSDGSVKWIFDAHYPIVTYQESSAGTIQIVAQSTPSNRTLYVLDGPDGSILSQRPLLDEGACAWNAVLLLNSASTTYVICKDIAHSVLRIEAITVTGAEWFRVVSGTEVGLAPDGGVLIETADYETGQMFLTALLPQTGAVKWTRQMEFFDGWALSKGDVFVAPHRLVYGSQLVGFHKEVLRLSGEDGSILWNASCGVVNGSTSAGRPISGSNGEVYVPISDLDDRILAFSADGNNSWTLPCAGSKNLVRYTQQNEDGTAEDIFVSQVLQGHDVASVCACSGTTGQVLWNTSFAENEIVTYAGPDGTVLARSYLEDQAVAIRQGSVAWRTRYFMNALMAKDGTAYLQHWSHQNPQNMNMTIEALDTNGVRKWSLPITCPTGGSVHDAQSSFVSV